MNEAIERIRQHVEQHSKREQAYFSIAGVKHLLAEYDRLSDEIVTLQRMLLEEQSK